MFYVCFPIPCNCEGTTQEITSCPNCGGYRGVKKPTENILLLPQDVCILTDEQVADLCRDQTSTQAIIAVGKLLRAGRISAKHRTILRLWLLSIRPEVCSACSIVSGTLLKLGHRTYKKDPWSLVEMLENTLSVLVCGKSAAFCQDPSSEIVACSLAAETAITTVGRVVDFRTLQELKDRPARLSWLDGHLDPLTEAPWLKPQEEHLPDDLLSD